ncbi:MAG: hypothetical protein JHC93_02805 [Parachlamydiales bacterium]|nr:hypothetical protein [Parachlamydiales bacterium]
MSRIDNNIPPGFSIFKGAPTGDDNNPFFDAYKNVLFKMSLLAAIENTVSYAYDSKREEIKKEAEQQKAMMNQAETKDAQLDGNDVEDPEFLKKEKSSRAEEGKSTKGKKDKNETDETGFLDEVLGTEAPEETDQSAESDEDAHGNHYGSDSEDIPNFFWDKASKASKSPEKQIPQELKQGDVEPEVTEKFLDEQAPISAPVANKFQAPAKSEAKAEMPVKSEKEQSALAKSKAKDVNQLKKLPQEVTEEELSPANKKMGAAKAAGDNPPWQKDPAGWTFYLVNWLVNDKIIPEAYAQLDSLAKQANINAKEMSLLNKIRSEMRKMGKQSKLGNYTYGQLKAHPSLIKKLEAIFASIRQLFNFISKLEKYTVPSTMAKQAKSMSADFHRMLNNPKGIGKFYKSMESRVNAMYNHYVKYHTLNSSFLNKYWKSGDKFISGWNKYVNVSAFIMYTTAGGGKKLKPNTHYYYAWNNMGIGGPWTGINSITADLNLQLNEIGIQLQTETQVTMMSFQTKLEAAMSVIEQLAKLLNTLAQNMRGAG